MNTVAGLKITIGDNGAGIAETIDIANSKGFGLKLVDMMARQLHGTMKSDPFSTCRTIIIDYKMRSGAMPGRSLFLARRSGHTQFKSEKLTCINSF